MSKRISISFSHISTVGHGRIVGHRHLCFICAVKLAQEIDANDRGENLFMESNSGREKCDECGRSLDDRIDLDLDQIMPKSFRVVPE